MAQPLRQPDYTDRPLQPRTAPRPTPSPGQSRQRRKRNKSYVILDERVKLPRGVKLARATGVMTVALVVCVLVFAQAYVSARTRELNSLQRDLHSVIGLNNNLRSANLGVDNLEEVQLYAMEVLGMGFPNENQIVYFDDVQVGFTVRHVVDETNISFWDILRSMFGTFRSE